MRAESPGPQHEWLDADAGPVVRPYTLTGGRVRPSVCLDVVAFVLAARAVDPATRAALHPEQRRMVELTRRPLPVAELAAELDLALGVVRVLVGDLLARGLVSVHAPAGTTFLPDDNILKAVVSGLRAL
ncbi:DUF742 domain-containing protein [Micromonospora sp. DT233]|uniref:DUF742 domain-containing protein n=1 Tax=Micromonospora sp. DT233 TaxID=3393432 RepID=UPI003CEBD367